MRPAPLCQNHPEGIAVRYRINVGAVILKEPLRVLLLRFRTVSYGDLPVRANRKHVPQVIRNFISLVASVEGKNVAFDLPLFKLANQRNRSFGTIRSLKYVLD